jgi:hypothetical protein
MEAISSQPLGEFTKIQTVVGGVHSMENRIEERRKIIQESAIGQPFLARIDEWKNYIRGDKSYDTDRVVEMQVQLSGKKEAKTAQEKEQKKQQIKELTENSSLPKTLQAYFSLERILNNQGATLEKALQEKNSELHQSLDDLQIDGKEELLEVLSGDFEASEKYTEAEKEVLRYESEMLKQFIEPFKEILDDEKQDLLEKQQKELEAKEFAEKYGVAPDEKVTFKGQPIMTAREAQVLVAQRAEQAGWTKERGEEWLKAQIKQGQSI